MEDFRAKTDEELFAIKHRKPAPNSTTHEVDTEIQRRLQERNLEQINSLIGEVSKLKDIADTNSRSSERLSIIAISIALLSLVAQVLFSTHQTLRCGTSFQSNTAPTQYGDCYKTFDFGLFGERTYRIPDFTSPSK